MSRVILVAIGLLCGIGSAVCGQELVNLELSSLQRKYSIEKPVDSKSADFSMGKPGKLIIFYESAPYHGGPGGMSLQKVDATRGLLEEPPTMGTTILNEMRPEEGGFAERKTIRQEILIPGPLPEGQKYRALLVGWHEYQAFQIRGDGTQKPAVQKLAISFIPWDKLPSEPGPAAEVDIAGKWLNGEAGNTSVMVVTPKGNGEYEVVENGFDEARGVARVKGRTIYFEYTLTKPGPNKGKRGVLVVTIGKEGKYGKGWTVGDHGVGGATWTYWSDKPVKPITEVDTAEPTTKVPPSDKSAPESNGFTVKIGKVKVKAGEMVTLPVEVLKPTDVSSLNVEVGYSSSVASVKEKPIPGDLKGNRLYEANSGESGVVLVGLAGSAPLSSDGQLAVISFTAVGKPGEKTPLTVKVTSANLSNGSPVTAATIDGELEIVSQSPGDTNNDGVVDPRDALDALKMSVRLLPVNLAADMDGNQIITANDARMILLKAVGK